MVSFLNMTFFAIAMFMLINGAILVFMILGATFFEKFGDWFVDSKLFKVEVGLFAIPAMVVVLMMVVQLFAMCWR